MSMPHPHRLAVVVAALCVVGCAPRTPPVSSAAPQDATAATPAPDTAATLLAYEWQLDSATDAAGQSIATFFPSPDTQLGLMFSDGRINVTGGCNRISAGYQLLNSGQLQASQGASTMMACPPPLANADSAFASFLAGTLQVAIEGESGAPRLRLAAADGSTLIFDGAPTAETRFGGPGTRAFLEVSAQPCAAPAASSCLMVRDRYFDENGIASGSPGEWRPLPGGIEGYTATAGQQQVVRVKRFEQAGAAGSEPTVHFVFDMVVETRTVQ